MSDAILEPIRAAHKAAVEQLAETERVLAATLKLAQQYRDEVSTIKGTVDSLARLLHKHGDAQPPPVKPVATTKTPRGSIDYEEVARVAREARADGRNMIEAVAEALGCSTVQAEGRIQTARNKGLLTSTRPVTGDVSLQCEDCDAEFNPADVLRLAMHSADAHNRQPTRTERTPRKRRTEGSDGE